MKSGPFYTCDDLGIKVVTLSPETVPVEDIHRLVSLGVCLGHSNADGKAVHAALEAGLRGLPIYPAQFLGLDSGRIFSSARADLILLDEQPRVKKTWISGC